MRFVENYNPIQEEKNNYFISPQINEIYFFKLSSSEGGIFFLKRIKDKTDTNSGDLYGYFTGVRKS
jgi:hypothetical protein